MESTYKVFNQALDYGSCSEPYLLPRSRKWATTKRFLKTKAITAVSTFILWIKKCQKLRKVN